MAILKDIPKPGHPPVGCKSALEHWTEEEDAQLRHNAIVDCDPREGLQRGFCDCIDRAIKLGIKIGH